LFAIVKPVSVRSCTSQMPVEKTNPIQPQIKENKAPVACPGPGSPPRMPHSATLSLGFIWPLEKTNPF
jgi:hypothetical protein